MNSINEKEVLPVEESAFNTFAELMNRIVEMAEMAAIKEPPHILAMKLLEIKAIDNELTKVRRLMHNVATLNKLVEDETNEN